MTKIFKSQFRTIEPEIEFAKVIVGDSVETTERILKEVIADTGLNIEYKFNGDIIEIRCSHPDLLETYTAELVSFDVSRQEGTELRPVPYIKVGTNALIDPSDIPYEYDEEEYIEMFLTGDFEADLRELLAEFVRYVSGSVSHGLKVLADYKTVFPDATDLPKSRVVMILEISFALEKKAV